jgi:hypothetical protein
VFIYLLAVSFRRFEGYADVQPVFIFAAGNEKLSRNDLQKYTSIFFPKLTQVDLKTLIKGNGMSFEKLKELVKNHELEVLRHRLLSYSFRKMY